MHVHAWGGWGWRVSPSWTESDRAPAPSPGLSTCAHTPPLPPPSRRLPLVEALCGGGTVSVQTLDGQQLTVALPEGVTPQSEKVVPGRGMPVTKTLGQKGDLRIRCGAGWGLLWLGAAVGTSSLCMTLGCTLHCCCRFDIQFPQLSDAQKAQLRQMLPR